MLELEPEAGVQRLCLHLRLAARHARQRENRGDGRGLARAPCWSSTTSRRSSRSSAATSSGPGYRDPRAADGPEALRLAALHRPDLVVLDLMLPGIDGIEVMRRLHERPGEPIAVILLTARGEESDRLVGLRRGADDYVVKPFSPAELVARVEAVLRRVAPGARPRTSGRRRSSTGRCGSSRRPAASSSTARSCSLTQREFDLLAYLAAQPGRVFSRDQLMEAVWGYALLHRHQHRHRPRPPAARQARATTPPSPRFIETVWGVGYRFRP